MGKYVYNSSLPFVRPNFNGNRLNGGRFTNFPYPDPEESLRSFFSRKFNPDLKSLEGKKASFKLAPQILPSLPQSPERYLIWLGHATFLIKMGDVTILTDPVVGKLPLVKRRAAFPIAVEELKHIDYILISHAHRDHFDIKSLNKILHNNPGAEIFGPLRIGTLLDKLASKPAHQEAGWYQLFEVKKKLKIVYLPAIHYHRRGIFDLNEVLWGSFYISDGEQSIYFAGDTSYNKHFKSIKDVMGAPDICLLPIRSHKADDINKSSNLSTEEAVKAFAQMEGKVMIPMHYGTFDIFDQPPGEAMRLLQNMQENEQLHSHMHPLQPGEIFPF